jgi:hypothetical protein
MSLAFLDRSCRAGVDTGLTALAASEAPRKTAPIIQFGDALPAVLIGPILLQNGGSRVFPQLTLRDLGFRLAGTQAARRKACTCLAGGSRDVGGDDVGGVPVQGCPGPVVSHGVRGSAWEAASCTSLRGTPASRAAVNACRSVCGPTFLAIWARRATQRTIRPAPCRSSRRPSGARKTGPWHRSPMARSIARAVRGASGIVTTLPPLRVMIRVR